MDKTNIYKLFLLYYDNNNNCIDSGLDGHITTYDELLEIIIYMCMFFLVWILPWKAEHYPNKSRR